MFERKPSRVCWAIGMLSSIPGEGGKEIFALDSTYLTADV